MCNPARSTASCKDHSEHLSRDADGFQDDTRVEVNVRIQTTFNEVLVFSRNLLQLHRDLQQWIIFHTELSQNFVTGLLHDFSAWVEVLVNAVTEAHQTEWIFFVFRFCNELVDV